MKFSIPIFFVLATSLLAVPAFADNALTPVRLGLDTAAGGSFQFREAVAQGYFANHGIKAAPFNFAFGIDTINALLIDRVDVAQAADYALVNSLGRGDFVVVSVLSRTTDRTKGNTVLFARNTIKTPKDLVGKKLGVAKGTVLEYIWAKYLEAHKIDPSSVAFVPYSAPDEAAVGLQRGDIDAVWQFGALAEKFSAIPGLVRFGDLGDSGTKTTSFLLFERAFVRAHPDLVTKTLLSIKEGADFVEAHPAETGDLAFKELKLPAANVVKDVARSDYSLGFSEDDFKHLEDIKNWVVQKGVLKLNYTLRDEFLLGPLKAAFPTLVTYDPTQN